jgi:hypothetical protein
MHTEADDVGQTHWTNCGNPPRTVFDNASYSSEKDRDDGARSERIKAGGRKT